MKFIDEYKKCLACLVMLIFLIALQMVTGHDTTPWISKLLEGMTAFFLAGFVRFSVLKTSEREIIRNNLPVKDDDDYGPGDPGDWLSPSAKGIF